MTSRRAIRAGLAGIAVLAACSDDFTIAPVIDLPSNAAASPLPLDSVALAVAHAGDATDIESQTFGANQTVQLGAVPFADDLVVHLTGFVSANDQQADSYGRTCSFAVAQDTPPPTPHLLFSLSASFVELTYSPETAPLPRQRGLDITYYDGTGIVLGGVAPSDSVSPVSEVEQLDPNRQTLQTIGSLQPRTGAVVAPLGTTAPQLVVIGGTDFATQMSATYIESIVVEKAADQRITMVPDAQALIARRDLTATPLTTETGPIAVIGGRSDDGSASGAVNLIELDNGLPVIDAAGPTTLADPRFGHTATLLGNDVGADVLVAGGIDGSGAPTAVAELYKPLSNGFSQTFSARMIYPRAYHQAAALPDGSVLFIGGYSDAAMQTPVSTVERFTLDGGFEDAGSPCAAGDSCPDGASCPAAGRCVLDLAKSAVPIGIVGVTVTPLPNGCLLLTGGQTSVTAAPIATASLLCLDTTHPGEDYIYSLLTSSLSAPRAFHQATRLCDGTIMVSGGTASASPIERYNPNSDGRR